MTSAKGIIRRSILKGLAALPFIATPMAAHPKPLNIEDYPLEDRADYYAAQLTRAMQAKHGGEWFYAIRPENGFVLIRQYEGTKS